MPLNKLAWKFTKDFVTGLLKKKLENVSEYSIDVERRFCYYWKLSMKTAMKYYRQKLACQVFYSGKKFQYR